MVSIAGSKKLKRQMAPIFWGITRKDKRFVITVKPGGHKKSLSIPTAVFVRDTLKLVYTLREAKSVVYGGKIKIDRVVGKPNHDRLGVIDVVEMDGVPYIFRLLPTEVPMVKTTKINAIG